MSFIDSVIESAKAAGEALAVAGENIFKFLWDRHDQSAEALGQFNQDFRQAMIREGAAPELVAQIAEISPVLAGSIAQKTPEELEALIKQIADSPEMVGKISRISTAMAQKIAGEVETAKATAGGVLATIGGKLMGAAHLIVLGGLAGITAFRTFTVDRAFLQSRWNSVIDEIPFPQWVKDALHAKPPTFRTTGALSASDVEALFNSFLYQGATGINDPQQGASTLFTGDNFQNVLTYLYTKRLREGKDTSKKALTAEVEPLIVIPPTAKNAAAFAAAPAAPGAAPITATINIQGLPAQSFVVPRSVITKITDSTELQKAISQDLQQFLGELVHRLSFTMARRDFVITPKGMMLRPEPSYFMEADPHDSTKPPKLVTNKIIVLGIYYINAKGDRIKLDEYPLDYSIADSVITPPPPEGKEESPVQVQIATLSSTPPAAVTSPSGGVTAPGAASAQTTTLPSAFPASSGGAGSPSPAAPVLVTAADVEREWNPTGGTGVLGGGLTQNFTFRGKTYSITSPAGFTNPQRFELYAAEINKQATPPPPPASASLTAAQAHPLIGEQFATPRLVTAAAGGVHVRAEPNAQSPLAGSQALNAGVRFFVTGWTTGENVQGENRWWHSQFGHYVWVGGTLEKP